ncbi:fibronectin type III domain-containing protein [Dyadobacter sp. CY343]|uniref:fibronectin type III domain-containing protein n=1 Tax=Dyadobacter sp. CY343 TaxID=2907299 RepID=UPI001F306A59|nr:fibronectin type III domain-containing protein [Dyadobacter sp. CY343]MCE7059973.1 fibronectin type III domain-containing protein [Dyadobacter sp. CY343]
MKKGYLNQYLLFSLLACFLSLFSHQKANAFLIPKAPSNLTIVSVTTSSISLSWTDNALDETGFELETSTDGLKYAKIADLKLNSVSYVHDSLAAGKKFWYRVRSKNASGFSAYSNIVTATTLSPITIPKPPTTLVATAISASQIALTWVDNATDETAFEIEQSTDGITFAEIDEVLKDIVIYQNVGLEPATKYWYRVAAKNSAGKSAYSNIATATTLQVPPAAPTALSGVSVSQTQINLSWTDASDNETGFEVERSLNGITYLKIAAVSTSVTTFQNTGLVTNTLYYYRVRAVNAAGASAYSNVGSFRTQNIPAPNQPVNFTAVPTSPGLIQLRWAAVTGNATETIIERTKASDENFVEIGRVPVATLQFEDREELETVDYFYRIKAVNAGGSSPYSLLSLVRAASIITSVDDPGNGYELYLAGKTLIANTPHTGAGELLIYNMNGRKITAITILKALRLDLSGWHAGIYIAVIRTDREVISRKIALY